MSPEQKQLLRDALIAGLVVSAPLSLPMSTLRNTARAAGFVLANEEVESHLDYIVEKGFATVSREVVSVGVQRWKATAAAVEYCEERRLV